MTNGPIARSSADPVGSASSALLPSADHAVWRIPGIFKADATLVAAELDALGWRQRPLTPRQILEYARNSETELHKCFDWDDSAAAEKYRLDQARRVCVSLKIVIEGRDGPEHKRLAVHVGASGDTTGGYMPIKMVSRDEKRVHETRAQAVSDLRAWLARYRELESTFGLSFGRVRQAVEEIVGVIEE